MLGFGSKNKDSLEYDVKEFRDETGLSTRRLDWGLWFIRHRKKTVIAAVWCLALLGAATLAYSLYSFGHYLIVGRAEDLRLYKELSAPVAVPDNSNNRPLAFGTPQIFMGAASRGDIVVAATNPNPRATARFSYHFDVNGQSLGASTDFILPGETKYIMALGQALPAAAGAALVIDTYSLERLDPHEISDWGAYRASRLDFLIQDAVFVPGATSGLSEKISVGEVSFKISNRTPYGYRSVRLIMLLKSGGSVIGVNDYRIENFRSGETRSPRLTWTGAAPLGSEIEIIPDLDIMNNSVYLQYSAL